MRQTFSHLGAEGAITRATVGNEKGHGVTLTTIVNYEKYQGLTPSEGQPRATDWAEDRASRGPTEGPIKPDQPDQPEKQLPLAPSPAASPPSAVVVVLPCVGAGLREYGVTDAQLDKWRTQFPGLDHGP